MSYPIPHKKLSPPLHLDGSLKVPVADALRRDTRGVRSAAKKIANDLDVHENTAKNYLAGSTEIPGAKLLALAAKGYAHVRALVIEQLGLPDEQALQQELDALHVRLGRLEASYAGETHVSMVRKIDGVGPSEPRQGPRG